MKLYETNLIDFTEVDDNVIMEGLRTGVVKVDYRLKEHHFVPVEEKRTGKTVEQIFNELKEQGVPVEIHNGVYCKFIYNTYEAINPVPEIDDWDEYEEIYVKGE